MNTLTRHGFDRVTLTVLDSVAPSGPCRVSSELGNRRGFSVPCQITNCSKPATRTKKTLCEAHYCRLRRGIPLDKPVYARRLEGDHCRVEGCPTPRHGGSYCSKHEARIRRHGDSEAWHPVPGQPGATNPAWTGEHASYEAAHQRLGATRGQPKRCDLCGTTEERRYHWALNWHGAPKVRYEINGPTKTKGLPYSTDPLDYVRACIPCHKRMDMESLKSRWVTTHPLEAAELGLTLHSWDLRHSSEFNEEAYP